MLSIWSKAVPAFVENNQVKDRGYIVIMNAKFSLKGKSFISKD